MSKGNYIFPDILAAMMKGVSQRTQYEAELMSLTFILLGLIVMGIYTCFYTDLSLFLKILTAVNVLAGFIFLFSRLVTSFQQYQNYMIVAGIINQEETERRLQ